jgi:hypothetical protein
MTLKKLRRAINWHNGWVVEFKRYKIILCVIYNALNDEEWGDFRL